MPKRSKHRKKKKTAFSEKNDKEWIGINFPATVAGMVTTILLVLLAWGNWSTPQETANVLAAIDDPSRASKAINEIDLADFDQVLKFGSAFQLQNILMSHNPVEERRKEIAFQVLANRRRILIADQMLGMPLTGPLRESALISKINAMVAIHELNRRNHVRGPNVTASLRTVSESLKGDTNKQVELAARLAIFRLNSVEMIAGLQQPSFTTIVDEIESLNQNQDFIDNISVLNAVRQAVDFYFSLPDHRAGVAFVEELVERVDISSSPQLAKAFDEFSDTALLYGSGLYDAYADRWANGGPGQQQLVKIAVELAMNPQSGQRVIVNLDKIASWFEQIDQYEMANQIFQTMLDHCDDYQRPGAFSLGRKTAGDGLRRIQLVGKPLVLTGTLSNGDPIDPIEYEDKIIVVVFWSSHDSDSVKSLQQVVDESDLWRNHSARIIAVCIDPTYGADSEPFADQIPGLQIVIQNPSNDGNDTIFDQCPSARIPRAMLVGKDGNVIDVDVPLLEINTQVNHLLNSTQ